MRRVRSGTAAVALVAVVAALTICLGTWQGWLAEAQTVRWVNDADDAGEPTECSTATAYASIAGALGASVDGDIIRLCEGTYDAGIVVDRKVTIEGQADVDIDKIVIDGTAGGVNGIDVTADDVTIRHLTLVGPTGGDLGIYVDFDVDDTTITDVDVSAWAAGIFVDIGATDTTIEASNAHANEDGIGLNGSEATHILSNDIVDNTDYGILTDSPDLALVADNTISGNDTAQVWLTSTNHIRLLRNDIVTDNDGILISDVRAEAFIQIGGSPENANSFSGPLSAGHYYVSLDCGAQNTVDATYNYWGGTGLARSDVANRIFNDEDDDGTECAAPDDVKGAVVFHPWATEPAPTPSPSPTPTPSPTPSPSPTPVAGTRDFDLPLGWNNFVWTGADATPADTALNCIAGDFAIAYHWDGTAWKRYVPDDPSITTLTSVDKYDSLLVLVTASDVQCLAMPVEP